MINKQPVVIGNRSHDSNIAHQLSSHLSTAHQIQRSLLEIFFSCFFLLFSETIFRLQTSFWRGFFWGATRGCVVIYLILLTAFKLLLYRLSPTTFGGWASLTRPPRQSEYSIWQPPRRVARARKKGKWFFLVALHLFVQKNLIHTDRPNLLPPIENFKRSINGLIDRKLWFRC